MRFNNIRIFQDLLKSTSTDERMFTAQEVTDAITQALAFQKLELSKTEEDSPSVVDYDMAILRQYALHQSLQLTVQGGRAYSMDEVIDGANKILKYLGHGNEIIPSAKAYRAVLSEQKPPARNGYV